MPNISSRPVELLWDTDWTDAPAHLALNKAPGSGAAGAGHLPCMGEKQLQPPVSPHISTGTIPTTESSSLLAGSSMGMDAQRSYELHRLTNLPWLEVQGGKTKTSSPERDAVGVICTCLAVQMPSLPLPWIIPPGTPEEELAPCGTGIISLQCAAQESVIHPLKYLVTANHNTASWWKIPLLSMKWSALPSKQKTPRAHK